MVLLCCISSQYRPPDMWCCCAVYPNSTVLLTDVVLLCCISSQYRPPGHDSSVTKFADFSAPSFLSCDLTFGTACAFKLGKSQKLMAVCHREQSVSAVTGFALERGHWFGTVVEIWAVIKYRETEHTAPDCSHQTHSTSL